MMQQRAEHYLELSESPSPSVDFSIEGIQVYIMQILCLVCLGRGARAWMKVGAAIRIVQGLELHMEPFKSHELPTQQDLVRLCVHTLYTMDRFSVCGSNRPMMFSDETLRALRLPSSDEISDEPNAIIRPTPKFSELWISGGRQSQRQAVLHMFTNIVVLLGKCNQYLQTGGVQGDSHFPWHPMSNLSGLVSELGKWKDKVEAEIRPHDLDISQTTSVNRFYLSWFIYHAIFVRLYRQFLPLISGSRISDDLSDPWQQETSRKCVEHAVKMSEMCDQAHAHGYSWPYFTSFCLGTACTVLIHSAYYEYAAAYKAHLENIVEKILDMRRCSHLVDYQCEMLRKMHSLHASMVRNYRSGTLVTTNLHLTQFYKRYPEGEFDQAHIPFSTLGNWMDPGLDGPDDLFAIGALPQRLSSLRGTSYTYFELPDDQPQLSRQMDPSLNFQSTTTSASFLDEGQIYSPSLMSALDGYFEFEAASASQGVPESMQTESDADIGQNLINSVLQQVSEDAYRGLEF
ncbi:hypothetical protein B0T10DRAFT_71044 [Thelonectria olida]|uniref:Xylanolytic transcriptional activator regulatory domain-containing protein n=1 Tax=Thelonectria olida TaxID=1576542 RepID=A0A9P9ANY3_9HYPO|nr:hypothetical protein B0T10DRAFT_71044 [Thelonectria olida]